MSSETSSTKAADWFGIGLRLIAVLVLFYGIQNLLYFVDLRLGWSALPKGFSNTNISGYLIYAVGYIGLGLVTLINATAITRLTYPDNSNVESEDPDAP